MMKLTQTFLISISTLLLSTTLMARGDDGYNNWETQTSSITDITSVGETLAFMREEEKVARDVYRILGDQWGLRVFKKITLSEQRHMDAISGRLTQYGIQDPVVDDTTGAFTNPELEQIYLDLIQRGMLSQQEALQVAAFIEEFDIRDLKQALSETDHIDLIRVYENLMRGSRNHLRAFVRQIENQGTVYTAQLLPIEEVNAILNSDMERGGHSQGHQGHGYGKGYKMRQNEF